MLTLKERTMLGNVPDDWDTGSLHALLSANYPGDWGDDHGPNVARVIRSTNLTNEGHLDLADVALRALPRRIVELLSPRANDILLERSGGGPGQPVGRVGFIDEDLSGYAFSNFLHLLRPNPIACNPRFLRWVLYQVNRTGRIIRLEQQTTQMRNLNFRDYLTMTLPVPPLDEQSVIAQILDAVDTALERTQVIIDRARDLKRSIVQRLFEEGTRKEPRRKTSIGPIPRSWDVVPVKDVVRWFQYGLSVPMQMSGSVPILRMGNIQNGEVTMDDLKYVSLSDQILDPYRLDRGDVLFNRTNSQEWVGKIGIYRHATPAVFASYLIRLFPNRMRVDGYYLGHLLASYPVQCRIKRFSTPGVQQVNINATNLGKVLIPLPTGATGLDEQREIAAALEAADSAVRSHSPVFEAYRILKKSLLHTLLSGGVRVVAANSTVGMVAS